MVSWVCLVSDFLLVSDSGGPVISGQLRGTAVYIRNLCVWDASPLTTDHILSATGLPNMSKAPHITVKLDPKLVNIKEKLKLFIFSH